MFKRYFFFFEPWILHIRSFPFVFNFANRNLCIFNHKGNQWLAHHDIQNKFSICHMTPVECLLVACFL